MADNIILEFPDELLRLPISFLGVGRFAYIFLVCSRFKIAYLANVSNEKLTTDESVTSSISCAEKYFEDAGTGSGHLIFCWYNLARYGRVDIMEWARRQGYARVRNEQLYVSTEVSRRAAKYGQLAGLQWLQIEQSGIFSYG